MPEADGAICEHASEYGTCIDHVSAWVSAGDWYGNSAPDVLICNPNFSVVLVGWTMTVEAE